MTTNEQSPVPVQNLAKAIEQGYRHLRIIDGVVVGTWDFLFTRAIMVGLDVDGYQRRYCYEDRDEVVPCLEAWDGTGHPGGNWIRSCGRDGEIRNPDHIDPVTGKKSVWIG